MAFEVSRVRQQKSPHSSRSTLFADSTTSISTVVLSPVSVVPPTAAAIVLYTQSWRP